MKVAPPVEALIRLCGDCLHDICTVNYNSTHPAPEVTRALAAGDPRVRLINCTPNDVGRALRAVLRGDDRALHPDHGL